MLNKLIQRRAQFLCFALIGVVNTVVHGTVLVLAVEFLGAGVVPGHLLAFCVANLISYVLNSKLTFKAPLALARYARFFVASLLALGLTLLLSWVLDRLGFHYLAGFAVIIALVPLLSFLVMKVYVFSAAQEPSRPA